MANLYESDDFNIVSVHEITNVDVNPDGTSDTYTNLLIKVQRLPLDQYPDLTDVFIFSNELSSSASKDDFLSAAPSLIASKLRDFDSTFTAEEADLIATDSLTQKFTD